MTALTLFACPGADASRWSEPLAVSPSGENTQAPQVAVNARGDEAVVWQRVVSEFHSIVELSVKPANGSFSAPITITEAPGQNETPWVSVGPEGRMLVTWTTEAGTEHLARELVMASWGSVAGGTFTAPQAISDFEGGSGWMDPRTVITDDGGAIAIWHGLDDEIHYTTSAPGSQSFSAAKAIANPNESVNDQVISISPSGAAVVAWTGWGTHLTSIYAAVREPEGAFGATQTLATDACEAYPLKAAINDAGTAVLSWSEDWRELSEKECETGGTPTWLRASYRSPGEPFGAPVNAAEMGAGAYAGNAAVSQAGRVTISATGILSSPAAASRDTTLTRLADGTYGDPVPIAQQQPDEPVALAYDASGNLYAASETREESTGKAISGVLAGIDAAGDDFAFDSTSLQMGFSGFDSAPVIAAAGEGHALTAWGASGRESRIELSEVQPGEPAGAGEAPAGTPRQPAGELQSVATESPAGAGAGLPSASNESAPANEPAPGAKSAPIVDAGGAVARPTSAQATTTLRNLTVTGRSDRATAISVRLIHDGRIIRSAHAHLNGQSFTATLSLAHVLAGRYRLQIMRRHGRQERIEERTANLR